MAAGLEVHEGGVDLGEEGCGRGGGEGSDWEEGGGEGVAVEAAEHAWTHRKTCRKGDGS